MNDNSKSKAISAGAMLRRYGEQALRDVCSFMMSYCLRTHVIERTFVNYWKTGQKISTIVKGFGSVPASPTVGSS